MAAASIALGASILASPRAVADSGAAAPPATHAAAADSTVQDPGLASTTAPAWVPGHGVASRERWEVALGLPWRVASLPLSGLGYLTKCGMRWEEQQNLAAQHAAFLASLRSGLGLKAGSSHLGPGTGFGGAIDFRPPRTRGWVEFDLEGSTSKYTRTAVQVGGGPASLSYAYDWRPQDLLFGIGLGASEDSASSFAWRQQRVRLALGYPWKRPGQPQPRTVASAWVGPREIVIRHGRLHPSFEALRPALAGLINQREEHFVYGARLATDLRSGAPHWTRGGRAEVTVERFDKPIRSFTLRDGSTRPAQFTRITVGGETGVSFMRDPRTLRLAVKAVDLTLPRGGAPILPPDLSSLGGDDGLASFDLGRFRDMDLLYSKATYLIPLSQHLELDLHAETGGVFPTLRTARASRFENSFGFALRPRTMARPLGAFGADFGAEGFMLRYSLGRVE